jgi:hypothetical protein
VSSVSFSKKALFTFFWAMQPLMAILFGRYTLFPNQLYVIYGSWLVLSVFLVFKDFATIIRVQMKWLVFVLGYGVIFIVVSFFGVDFDAALKYQVLYLPLSALDFFVAFVIGYKVNELKVFRMMVFAGLLTILFLVADYYLFSSAINYLPPLNVTMTIPVAILTGFTSIASIVFVLIVASTKKAMTAIALVSVALAYWAKKRNNFVVNPNNDPINKPRRATAWLQKLTMLIVGSVLALLLFQNIQATLGRFLYEGDGDPTRTLIALTSYKLLLQYFPRGIGWGGFSSITRDDLNYQTVDLRGEVSVGANIHNSFVTWALEGGLPIVLLMLILFIYYFRTVRFFLKNEKSNLLGWVTLIWMLQGIFFGMFHQWHNTVLFWPLFGFTFGCYERYKRAL